MKKDILLLGSTGSIGETTLKVIKKDKKPLTFKYEKKLNIKNKRFYHNKKKEIL